MIIGIENHYLVILRVVVLDRFNCTFGCVNNIVLNLKLKIVSSFTDWSHTFVEIDREIISMVILLLLPIQEGLLSVTSGLMCTKYWLAVHNQACPGKSVVR